MDRARKFAVSGVLLFTVASNAGAADQGFYFGALGGRADYDFVQSRLPALAFGLPVVAIGTGPIAISVPAPGGSFVVAAGPPPVSLLQLQTRWQPTEDHRSSAWGAFAGYRIMRYAAVELTYQNLGKLEESGNALVVIPTKTPLGTPVSGEFKRELETSGPSVSALGILPITDAWSVYARAGVLVADMKLTSSIAGYTGSTSTDSTSLLWGAGTQFDFGAHWSVRADFQRFNDVGETEVTGRADIDLLSLGVIFQL